MNVVLGRSIISACLVAALPAIGEFVTDTDTFYDLMLQLSN